ncbi:tachylectin-related carbohydrate-binding protein [Salinispora mooreana]|uniref:tachylectin-related carbohydrate-binding protein n=1 Tax=Salinispora mooreana TaxID=999545 RepID=UPI00037EA0A5|nr:tachylectin-related carbohydrate-binding protein [Salinispora mooreana]
MFRPTHVRRRGTVPRRSALRLGLAIALIGSGITVTAGAHPAQASEDAFSCTGAAQFFNSTSSGTLTHRKYETPGYDDGSSGEWTAATTIGVGWQQFGRVLGGPDGRVYGIKSEGMFRYRWTGFGWERIDGVQGPQISSSFGSYAESANRNKITIDESGDFYTIDDTGRLRWHRYSESSKTWTVDGRVIDTGWDRYNLLFATSPGVLYARAADDRLYRYRFDPTTQRWISYNLHVGSGWGYYTSIFSAGGDTVYGVLDNGDLYQYRYREDLLDWELVFHKAGWGWRFPEIFATTNTCHQGAISSPALPSIPLQPNMPIAAMQAPAASTALGTLEIAYNDNIGQIRHGRANPDALGTIQWSAPANIVHVGTPALVADAEDNVNVFSQTSTSDIQRLTQKAPASPDWKPWLELGGAMKSAPAAIQLSDDSLAVFAYDTNGTLWSRQQDGTTGDLLPWTSTGATGLTGTPIAQIGPDRTATILATTSTGKVQTATWQAGTLTTEWTDLGDTQFTGSLTTTLLPGYRVMAVGHATNGTIQTQLQNINGTWPGTWTTIGDNSITPDGSPSTILSPTTGRAWVFIRATDGNIYRTRHTAAGSTTWTTWGPVTSGETYPVDPTAFTWQNSNGHQIAFVTRNTNGSIRLYAADETTTTTTTTKTTTEPTFTQHTIPTPHQ